MQEYEKLVEAGTLKSDAYQTQIIRKLQALHDALVVYHPPSPVVPPSLVHASFFTPAPSSADIPHIPSSLAFSPAPHPLLRT